MKLSKVMAENLRLLAVEGPMLRAVANRVGHITGTSAAGLIRRRLAIESGADLKVTITAHGLAWLRAEGMIT